MPIRDCRFIGHRPAFNIRIINPDTGVFFDTEGIVDTGADSCAIPASFAPILRHNLEKGDPTTVTTGNNDTRAFCHKTVIELKNGKKETVYTISRKIHFVEGLHVVLLGVHEFLGNHCLYIDYPAGKFSITSDTLQGP